MHIYGEERKMVFTNSRCISTQTDNAQPSALAPYEGVLRSVHVFILCTQNHTFLYMHNFSVVSSISGVKCSHQCCSPANRQQMPEPLRAGC